MSWSILLALIGILLFSATFFVKQWPKGLKLALRLAVVTAFVSLLLLGLPGLLFVLATIGITDLMSGSSRPVPPGTNNSWTHGIYVSLLWPFSFPSGYLVAWGLFKTQNSVMKWLILIGFSLLFGFVLSLIFLALIPLAV
jgi:hypothetical protein